MNININTRKEWENKARATEPERARSSQSENMRASEGARASESIFFCFLSLSLSRSLCPFLLLIHNRCLFVGEREPEAERERERKERAWWLRVPKKGILMIWGPQRRNPDVRLGGEGSGGRESGGLFLFVITFYFFLNLFYCLGGTKILIFHWFYKLSLKRKPQKHDIGTPKIIGFSLVLHGFWRKQSHLNHSL